MPTMMKLTLVDPGSPPVSINPNHVVYVKPRRQLKPDVATQGVHLANVWEGATVQLSTGTHHNVIEDHDTIVKRINEANNGSRYTEITPHLPKGAVTVSSNEGSTQSIPQSQISGLTETLNLRDTEQETKFTEALKDAGVPVSDKTTAEPEPPKPEPKKTPGPKKATGSKPPAGASSDKDDEEE